MSEYVSLDVEVGPWFHASPIVRVISLLKVPGGSDLIKAATTASTLSMSLPGSPVPHSILMKGLPGIEVTRIPDATSVTLMRPITPSFAASSASGVKSAVDPDSVPVQYKKAYVGCIQDLVPCHVASMHARTSTADISPAREIRNRRPRPGFVDVGDIAESFVVASTMANGRLSVCLL